MTLLRPIHPSHRAILDALAQRGPSVATDLGVGIATDVMHILVGRGWCFRVMRVAKGIRSAWLYDLTEEGREVLRVGLVPKAAPKANIELRRSRTFNRGTPLFAPSPKGCTHYWLLDARSVGQCRSCGETREFVRVGFSAVAS